MQSIFKYLVSGGTAAIVHYTILIGLVEIYDVEPLLATFIGLTVATFINYPLQYYWTFTALTPHSTAFPKYVLVTIAAYAINLFCFWVLEDIWGIYYILAQMIATGIALVINFVVNSRYTFTHKTSEAAEQL